ncbi:MAG TPA: sugar transferase, partial [Rubricoccaceae bacterium]
MTRRVELLALLVGDALGLGAAAALFEAACARYGWMVSAATDPISTVALFVLGWLFLFAFSGLYGERYAGGRFDEIVTLAKVTAFGVLALFFSYYLGRLAPESVRPALVVYAAGIIGGVGGLRLMIRGVQKALILRGHGLHRAVVVGWSDRVETLYHDLAKYPAAGIELVGAVRLRHTQPVLVGTLAHSRLADEASETLAEGDALPIGTLELTASGAPETAIAELPGLIDRLGVRDVLIALGTDDHLYLDEVLRVCDGR